LSVKPLRTRVFKEKTKDWNKVFQFRPTDSDPFYLIIKGGEVKLEKGSAPNAVATISCPQATWFSCSEANSTRFKRSFQVNLELRVTCSKPNHYNHS